MTSLSADKREAFAVENSSFTTWGCVLPKFLGGTELYGSELTHSGLNPRTSAVL